MASVKRREKEEEQSETEKSRERGARDKWQRGEMDAYMTN